MLAGTLFHQRLQPIAGRSAEIAQRLRGMKHVQFAQCNAGDVSEPPALAEHAPKWVELPREPAAYKPPWLPRTNVANVRRQHCLAAGLVIASSACRQDIQPINGRACRPAEVHFAVLV